MRIMDFASRATCSRAGDFDAFHLRGDYLFYPAMHAEIAMAQYLYVHIHVPGYSIGPLKARVCQYGF